MICYKFKPDKPQHVNFGNLKALRISKEKSAQPDKQRSIIYPKGVVAVVKKSAVQGHTESSEFYLIGLKEDINNLESKIKVLLFTHDPLLPLQFLAADKLLTIDAVNILEILQDDLEYEEDLIVLNKEKYYCLLSLCFDSGDIGMALEENEAVIELETLVEKESDQPTLPCRVQRSRKRKSRTDFCYY